VRGRLLLIRYGGIGDALMAGSVLPKLREEGWRIAADLSEVGEAVLRYHPCLDFIMVTPRGSVPSARLLDHWRGRSLGFERVVNLTGSIEDALLPTPECTAFWHDDAARRRLFGTTNYVERTHLIAGVSYDGVGDVRFVPTEAEESQAEIDAGLDGNEPSDAPRLGLVLGGSTDHKRWPHAPAFAAAWLKQNPAGRVLLLGGKADRPAAQAVRGEAMHMLGSADRALDCTDWDLRRSLAVLRWLSALVGPETGLMNAACANGVRKAVLLSHSSHDNLTRDWRNTVAIAPGAACHPCHRLHLKPGHCPLSPAGVPACADAVPPAAVLAALEQE
jgi:ADP-heptose:LPS heptosyltransferase